jgi:hypothetical protein
MSDDILWKTIGRIASQPIASQVALSRAFDQLLPRSFRVDGSKDFKQCIVPRYLRPGRIPPGYTPSCVRIASTL